MALLTVIFSSMRAACAAARAAEREVQKEILKNHQMINRVKAIYPESEVKESRITWDKEGNRIVQPIGVSPIPELLAENERLRDLLVDAIDEIESLGSYVDPYFQEGWGLKNVIARFRTELEKMNKEVEI